MRCDSSSTFAAITRFVRSRIATVEHQHVLVAQAVETFEQHLALTHQGTVQDQRIEQLDPGTKQAKQCRLAYATLPLAVKQGQANLRCIGGQHPQTQPERLRWQAFIDQAQQLCVEWVEDIGPKTTTRLRKRAGCHHPNQLAAPRQQGKERIKFALHGTTHTAEQESDQLRKGQTALAGEIPGILARRLAKGCAPDEVSKPGEYVDIFRPSYLTYTYQSVTGRILTKPRRHEPSGQKNQMC
jgi:hypothetical protein